MHVKAKTKPSASVLALPSESALGHLCATQVLGVSAGKFSWGRTGNPQEVVPCPTGEGAGTQSPTWTFTVPLGSSPTV